MSSNQFLVAFTLLALASTIATAYDPGILQDFCVATNDTNSRVFVNGKFCKDPMKAKPEDFFFSGLNIPRSTNNIYGSLVTILNADQIPGLNTLGISIVRIDYAPKGVNPPHTHPRASEILTVLEGILYAGFVTSNPNHRLFAKVLYPGDVFVIPFGLIHFQLNMAKTNAVAIATLSSQNPSVNTIADAVFGANPPINPDLLATAFQIDKNAVAYLQKKFAPLSN